MIYTLKNFLEGQFPIMVLDCESIGLHGETFAWGYTVIRPSGPVANMQYACPPEVAKGTDEDRGWVMENVPSFYHDCQTTLELRKKFWDRWTFWGKHHKALLATDVMWPVEANFISACIADDPAERKWSGPYPVLEISTLLSAAGINPLATLPRLQEELPIHDPEKDSAQSARILLETIRKLCAT